MALSKAPSPRINVQRPWDGDPLARKPEGEVLSSLISTLGDSPFVISLKGGWGSGKTIFLRRLGAHLEHHLKIPIIHVDAWQSDNIDDPLLIISSALSDRLKEIDDGKVARDIRGVISGLAGSAGKLSLPVLSILAAALLPGGSKVVEIASAMPQIAQNFLDWEGERKSAESTFRESLISAKEKLHKSLNGASDLPVVIIVDELDRCRPDFAIKFLERIKHFFNVDGICFLIATDYENLPNAVESVYGPNVKGELYLRKFFDYEFNLLPPKPEDHAIYLFSTFPEGLEESAAGEVRKEISERFSPGRYDQLFEDSRSALEQAEYAILFGWTASKMELSLRDTLQAHTLLMAFVRSYPKSEMRFPFIDCFVACLRFRDPKHFHTLLTGSNKSDYLATNLVGTAAVSQWALKATSTFVGIRKNHGANEFRSKLYRAISEGYRDKVEAMANQSLLTRTFSKADFQYDVINFDADNYLREVFNLSAAFTQTPEKKYR